MIDKNTLLDLLRTNIVAVEFIKKDGALRHMICTLDSSHIPSQDNERVSERKLRKALPADIVAVYDLEKEGWRSFNINSITRVQIDCSDLIIIPEDDGEETTVV